MALCFQQHGVINSQIPSAKTRVLTGLDNVDRWTEQAIWNTVLQNVRVVVSTHAVLADALTHGFVRMSRLALIVFDEGSVEQRSVTTISELIKTLNSSPLHASPPGKQNHAGPLSSSPKKVWAARSSADSRVDSKPHRSIK